MASLRIRSVPSSKVSGHSNTISSCTHSKRWTRSGRAVYSKVRARLSISALVPWMGWFLIDRSVAARWVLFVARGDPKSVSLAIPTHTSLLTRREGKHEETSPLAEIKRWLVDAERRGADAVNPPTQINPIPKLFDAFGYFDE